MKALRTRASVAVHQNTVQPPELPGAYFFDFSNKNYLFTNTTKTSNVEYNSAVAAATSICGTFTLSNSTSEQCPLYKGELGIYFDGSDDYLSGALSTLTYYYPGVIFISYSLGLTDVVENGLLASIRTNSTALLQLMVYSATTDRPFRVTARKSDDTITSINYTGAVNELYKTYVAGAEVPATGDAVSMYIQDSLYSSIGSIVLDNIDATPTTFRIGALSSTSTRFNGYIYKLMYTPADITSQDRINIVRWLNI